MIPIREILKSIKGSKTETITNENGTAVKFPDGTMICYGRKNLPSMSFTAAGYIYYSPKQNITFPVAFSAIPSTSISARTSNRAWVGNVVSGTSSCTFYVLNSLNTQPAPYIEWQAIGRWK